MSQHELREAGKGLRAICLVPTAADAAVCVKVLADSALRVATCTGPDEFDKALRPPVDLVLAAEEALEGRAGTALARFLADQEDWSVIPLIVLTKDVAQAGLRALNGAASAPRSRPSRPCPGACDASLPTSCDAPTRWASGSRSVRSAPSSHG